MKEDARMEKLKKQGVWIKNYIIKNVYYLERRAALHKPYF